MRRTRVDVGVVTIIKKGHWVMLLNFVWIYKMLEEQHKLDIINLWIAKTQHGKHNILPTWMYDTVNI